MEVQLEGFQQEVHTLLVVVQAWVEEEEVEVAQGVALLEAEVLTEGHHEVEEEIEAEGTGDLVLVSEAEEVLTGAMVFLQEVPVEGVNSEAVGVTLSPEEEALLPPQAVVALNPASLLLEEGKALCPEAEGALKDVLIQKHLVVEEIMFLEAEVLLQSLLLQPMLNVVVWLSLNVNLIARQYLSLQITVEDMEHRLLIA